MKIKPGTLEQQWNNISYVDGGFLQIDTEHPLEWYIVYQTIDRRTLLLISDSEIGKIDSSKSMIVTRRKRVFDNREALTFELLRDEQKSVFSIFCCDIIENSRSAKNEKDAIKFVLKRYKEWSKLLELQQSPIMDEHLQKGLLGELLFLEERLKSSENALMAIQGWAGPDRAAQDFVYSDGWFEIKSVSASAISVTISSLEQLAFEEVGELVVKRIDRATPRKLNAISLNEIVYRIDSQLSANYEAQNLFRVKLAQYGYIDLLEYSECKFFYSGMQCYIIDDSFPKLTRKCLPPQVMSLRYELDLLGLGEWLKKEE